MHLKYNYKEKNREKFTDEKDISPRNEDDSCKRDASRRAIKKKVPLDKGKPTKISSENTSYTSTATLLNECMNLSPLTGR